MGIFNCPECSINFNTDDKCSSHQVNDLVQDTFCSCECSVKYTITNALTIIKDQYGAIPLSASLFDQVITEFSSEGVYEEDLEKFNSLLK